VEVGPGVKTDWNPILAAELAKPYWAELQAFVASERAAGAVYPPKDDVFSAFHLTPFAGVRVVILGQDPYHGPGQAHGLCFSVRRGVATPPSLANIYKELAADVGCVAPKHGNLEAWATQGVLLLNTTMTVRAHEANSHQKRGWETFTDAVIDAVAAKEEPVVFILWGAAARKKRLRIEAIAPRRHVCLESAHPSPLSAHNGFIGSRPFSATNDALVAHGFAPIDWQLPD
jgi:uracil-DNA glycosylase